VVTNHHRRSQEQGYCFDRTGTLIMPRVSCFSFCCTLTLVLRPEAGLGLLSAFRTSLRPIPSFGIIKARVPLYSSFAADGSEYSSNRDSNDFEDDEERSNDFAGRKSNSYEDQEDAPTIELQPVPLSKNAGNRFVAVVWDKQLCQNKNTDPLEWHYNRVQLTEDHVLYCRKANLYNETFNFDSNVDVLWSLQM
jgi:hypothetical protein